MYQSTSNQGIIIYSIYMVNSIPYHLEIYTNLYLIQYPSIAENILEEQIMALVIVSASNPLVTHLASSISYWVT